MPTPSNKKKTKEEQRKLIARGRKAGLDSPERNRNLRAAGKLMSDQLRSKMKRKSTASSSLGSRLIRKILRKSNAR